MSKPDQKYSNWYGKGFIKIFLILIWLFRISRKDGLTTDIKSYIFSHLYICIDFMIFLTSYTELSRACQASMKLISDRQFTQIYLENSNKKMNTKGQLISKCLFGVFIFFQKTNGNKSTSSKIEFVHSVFGRNVGLKKLFRICRPLLTCCIPRAVKVSPFKILKPPNCTSI